MFWGEREARGALAPSNRGSPIGDATISRGEKVGIFLFVNGKGGKNIWLGYPIDAHLVDNISSCKLLFLLSRKI